MLRNQEGDSYGNPRKFDIRIFRIVFYIGELTTCNQIDSGDLEMLIEVFYTFEKCSGFLLIRKPVRLKMVNAPTQVKILFSKLLLNVGSWIESSTYGMTYL